MSEEIESKILEYLKSARARALKPSRLADELNVRDEHYPSFRDALRQLMHEGRVVVGTRGAVVLPASKQAATDRIIGTYRHHRRGFGFVIPTDPSGHEDLFIPEGQNGGAINGDIVAARITSRGQRDGKTLFEGRILEVIERTQKRFVGTLEKRHNQWQVLPDGNTFTAPILAPDAASRHIKAGTKVVIELTTYPEEGVAAQGVITEVLGQHGQKDVDLRGIIIQYNLPGPFPEPCLQQAREAVDKFNRAADWTERFDLSDETIVTIDPDDAKDYDDAISLHRRESGLIELGVHIADVSYFVTPGSPLDEEGKKRGNSCYFPGHVIPMLPEVLSNGVCSLQEGVPRLCKSVFITFDADGRPAGTRVANTIIRSCKRLRYVEAQRIIDKLPIIAHPDGDRSIKDYEPKVVKLLHEMNALARRIQKRRLAEGQIVLELPEVELVLDEEGRVVGTAKEDTSFTHTLIEMFMVEANEAVARMLDSLGVPFIRRVHPEPAIETQERMRHFVSVAGYKLPKVLDKKAIQGLLRAAEGKPESHAINLAVLKSLARAEYSPQPLGHYALASEHYCHFTSPIRRYADLTVHRLLDSYIRQRELLGGSGGRKRKKIDIEGVIPYDELVELGKKISFTERRAEDAERELRQVKILELLAAQIGSQWRGVVTGITNFGIFIQLQEYLIDGLIRYEDLLDDWWDVDERSGSIRGQRTGTRITIGDPADVLIVRVDVPRRELVLAVMKLPGRGGGAAEPSKEKGKKSATKGRSEAPAKGRGRTAPRGGGPRGGGPRGGGRRGGGKRR